jgi:hypothetical protein
MKGEFMSIYWSWKSLPEWRELPENERKIIWKKCYSKTLKHWQTWVAFFGCIAYVWLGRFLVIKIWTSFIGELIGAALGGAIGGFILGQVIVAMGRRHIRDYLNSHDEVRRA